MVAVGETTKRLLEHRSSVFLMISNSPVMIMRRLTQWRTSGSDFSAGPTIVLNGSPALDNLMNPDFRVSLGLDFSLLRNFLATLKTTASAAIATVCTFRCIVCESLSHMLSFLNSVRARGK